MLRVDSNFSTFLIAATIAGGILFTNIDGPESREAGIAAFLGSAEAQDAKMRSAQPRWAASATGRVEPKTGTVRIAAEAPGRITDVFVETGDQVLKGDLLAKLDDESALQRVRAAQAEADVRTLERDEEEVTGVALERRQLEDAVATARRDLFKARRAFEETVVLKDKGDARESDVTAARETIKTIEDRLSAARNDLEKLLARSDLPLPGRLDTSLTIARSDLALAEEALEKTRVTAPFDGAVLNVLAREGEMAAPTSPSPLVVFGDVGKLRVRAEVEERDVAKVRVGQKAVVKVDAYPDQEFAGVVTEVAGALGSPQITTRGPRRPNDVDVLEVVVDLEGSPPLITGMRVDVFFHLQNADARKTAATAGKMASH